MFSHVNKFIQCFMALFLNDLEIDFGILKVSVTTFLVVFAFFWEIL